MRYVYLLQSETVGSQRYVGVTSELESTNGDHNAGKSPHTSKHTPWKLVTYVAFSDARKAETFERYLKSGSGHAFAKKDYGRRRLHLLACATARQATRNQFPVCCCVYAGVAQW